MKLRHLSLIDPLMILQVHIDDLVDLYLLVFKLASSGSDKNTAYGKFYFGSADEHVWGDVARDIAPLLYEKGLVNNADAQSVSKKDEPRVTYVVFLLVYVDYANYLRHF